VDSWHCPECGEIEFAGKEGERYVEALEKLRIKVDAEEAAEEAAELARIRKKFGLPQRKAAELTGGVNAFSRYENGKAKPVPAVINLFRLPDKHPEFRDWIAEGDMQSLFDYRKRAPHAGQNHPTGEHLLPLFVALGAANDIRNAQHLNRVTTLGLLAMDAWVFDFPAE
jgi:putative zinc finger/helix-turn-helix YgiT family protein